MKYLNVYKEHGNLQGGGDERIAPSGTTENLAAQKLA